MTTVTKMSAGVCVLALVVMLCGCGGSGGVSGPSVDTAGKPAKPPSMPPVGDATGVIYYGLRSTGQTVRMDWDGGNPTVLSLWPPVADGFDVSYGTSRFFLFPKTVATHESPTYGTIGITNIHVQAEGGELVNIIEDDYFTTDQPTISLDDDTIIFPGAYWDPDLGDFTDIGIYMADLVYSGNLPSGIEHLRPALAPYQALSPDTTMAASASDPSGTGGDRDIRVGDIGLDNARIITNTPDLDELPPAWAPLPPSAMESRLAFGRSVEKRGRVKGYEIYTLLPDGSGAIRAVTSANTGVAWNSFPQAAPAWSPDATQLAFIARETEFGPCGIMRSAADGSTTAKNLTEGFPGLIWCVKWRS